MKNISSLIKKTILTLSAGAVILGSSCIPTDVVKKDTKRWLIPEIEQAKIKVTEHKDREGFVMYSDTSLVVWQYSGKQPIRKIEIKTKYEKRKDTEDKYDFVGYDTRVEDFIKGTVERKSKSNEPWIYKLLDTKAREIDHANKN